MLGNLATVVAEEKKATNEEDKEDGREEAEGLAQPSCNPALNNPAIDDTKNSLTQGDRYSELDSESQH